MRPGRGSTSEVSEDFESLQFHIERALLAATAASDYDALRETWTLEHCT
jgi:hypothetical protein